MIQHPDYLAKDESDYFDPVKAEQEGSKSIQAPYKFQAPTKQMALEQLPAFLKTMFSEDFNPNYVGYSFITTLSEITDEETKEVSLSMKNVLVKPADQLYTAVEDIKFHRQDYYISINRFKNPFNRDMDHLFGFDAIVIDIDDHNSNWHAPSLATMQKQHPSADMNYYADHIHGSSQERRVKINELIETLENDLFKDPDFPTPNVVVNTGRGVQIWFKLIPCSAYNHEYLYATLAEHLADLMEDFISGMPRFSNFSVDRSASLNPAGLMRLPGSYNTKTGTYGCFEILSDESMDMYEEAHKIIDARKKEGRTQDQEREIDPKKFKIGDTLACAQIRMDKLAKLLEYRHEHFPDMPESRDLFLFVVCNAFMTATEDAELAMQKVDEFNQLFWDPMPDREIKTYMGTSIRKKGYPMKNTTVIEKLNITEDEQNYCGITDGPITINLEERRERAKNKELRNSIICQSCDDGVWTENEISKLANTSPSTAHRVLNDNKKLTAKQKLHNKIVAACKRGTPMKKILKKYGGQMSRSGIYKIAHQVKEWRAKLDERKKQIAAIKRAKQWNGIFDHDKRSYQVTDKVRMYRGYGKHIIVDLENEPYTLQGFEWSDDYVPLYQYDDHFYVMTKQEYDDLNLPDLHDLDVLIREYWNFAHNKPFSFADLHHHYNSFEELVDTFGLGRPDPEDSYIHFQKMNVCKDPSTYTMEELSGFLD